MLSSVYLGQPDLAGRGWRIPRRRTYLISRLPICLELREPLSWLRSLIRVH